jgi:hypothetical protein
MQEICIYSNLLLLYFFQVNLETPIANGLKAKEWDKYKNLDLITIGTDPIHMSTFPLCRVYLHTNNVHSSIPSSKEEHIHSSVFQRGGSDSLLQ